MAKPNRYQFQHSQGPHRIVLHAIEWARKTCYRASMAPTHPSQLASTAREVIVRITDIAVDAAAAAGREVDRSALLAELVALFDSQLAAASPDDMRDALPPWKRFPRSFSTRFDYIENVFESSETSSYYEEIPLDAPHDAARRKVRLLAQSYRNYPED